MVHNARAPPTVDGLPAAHTKSRNAHVKALYQGGALTRPLRLAQRRPPPRPRRPRRVRTTRCWAPPTRRRLPRDRQSVRSKHRGGVSDRLAHARTQSTHRSSHMLGLNPNAAPSSARAHTLEEAERQHAVRLQLELAHRAGVLQHRAVLELQLLLGDRLLRQDLSDAATWIDRQGAPRKGSASSVANTCHTHWSMRANTRTRPRTPFLSGMLMAHSGRQRAPATAHRQHRVLQADVGRRPGPARSTVHSRRWRAAERAAVQSQQDGSRRHTLHTAIL